MGCKMEKQIVDSKKYNLAPVNRKDGIPWPRWHTQPPKEFEKVPKRNFREFQRVFQSFSELYKISKTVSQKFQRVSESFSELYKIP